MEMNGTAKITGEKIKSQMSTDDVYNKKRAGNYVENGKSSYTESSSSPEIIMLNETYNQCEKHRANLGQKGNNAAERTITGHLLGNNLRALSQTNMPLSTDVTDALKFVASEFKRINTHNAVLSAEKTSIPDADLWEMIADSINKIDENYMDVYEQAIQTYMNFFSDFAEAISEMSKFIISNPDENLPIEINYIGLFALFDELYSKYTDPFSEAGVLFSSDSQQEAIQWAEEFGLSTVTYNSRNGMYEVRIDMSPVESIMNGIAALFCPEADSFIPLEQAMEVLLEHNVDINNNYDVTQALWDVNIVNEILSVTGISGYKQPYFSSAEYQAFQAGFDAQEQIIQTTMQTMTQKYNTAVSLVDNLYKILSSTISSCTETLKAYLTN